MKLPEAFVAQMHKYFSHHAQMEEKLFFESFDGISQRGLRFNRLKVSPDQDAELLKLLDEENRRVPWCASGYYSADKVTGNHPLFHAGAYYIQEPSAMLPAEMLNAQPGDIVLDLCAAPGGKATRIAEQLKGRGILVANEISRSRSKALLYNIERMGIENALIYNEPPENLVTVFGSYFDKILIDAPCSGEGMFRRDPSAKASWTSYGPDATSKIQAHIIDCADQMLKPGGEIVYSTCTFSDIENEQIIAGFLKSHPQYKLVAHPELEGIISSVEISGHKSGYRIWPHLHDGEGHFCVHLKKDQGEMSINEHIHDHLSRHFARQKRLRNEEQSAVASFFDSVYHLHACAEYLENFECIYNHNGHVKKILSNNYSNNDIKCVKDGFYLGEIKEKGSKSIFTPSHALAIASTLHQIKEKNVICLSYSDDRAMRYLKGETIQLTSRENDKYVNKGFVMVALESFPLGWGKI